MDFQYNLKVTKKYIYFFPFYFKVNKQNTLIGNEKWPLARPHGCVQKNKWKS